MKYLTLIFILLFTQCSLYKIFTETKNISDEDRPQKDEGIAVFRFVSSDKAPLPNEIYFHLVKNPKKKYHFTLSSWLYEKDVYRYIFLQKGKYRFTHLYYQFEGKITGYSLPKNHFTIVPSRLNYVGDMIFQYHKKKINITIEDNIKKSLWPFYQKYPTLTIQYPLINSLITIDKKKKGGIDFD